MSEIKPKIGEDVSGLTVHKTAGDAVSNANAVTTIEEFTAKPVGLYDTETGDWVDVPETVLDDLTTIQNLNKEGDRYAVAFGDSLDNTEGFMNLEEYIEQVDFADLSKQKEAPSNNNAANNDLMKAIGESIPYLKRPEQTSSIEEYNPFSSNEKITPVSNADNSNAGSSKLMESIKNQNDKIINSNQSIEESINSPFFPQNKS